MVRVMKSIYGLVDPGVFTTPSSQYFPPNPPFWVCPTLKADNVGPPAGAFTLIAADRTFMASFHDW